MKETTKPFLKWLGSKRQLSSKIVNILPCGDGLIEPFVGSGSIFMASNYKTYILADINKDIICLYRHIKDNCELFIKESSKLFHDQRSSEDVYYNLRNEFNNTDDTFRRACIFLYLNKYGFNGVCRYNKKGGFNVPIGTLGKITAYPYDAIRGFSKKLT